MRPLVSLALLLSATTLVCANDSPRLVARSATGQIHTLGPSSELGRARKRPVENLVVFTDRASGEMRVLAESGIWSIPTVRISFHVVRLLGVQLAGDQVFVALWRSERVYDRAPQNMDPATGTFTVMAFGVSDGKKRGLTLSKGSEHFRRPAQMPVETRAAGVLRLAPGGVELFGVRVQTKKGNLMATKAATWVSLKAIGFHHHPGGLADDLDPAGLEAAFTPDGSPKPELLATLPPARSPREIADLKASGRLVEPRDGKIRAEVSRFNATHAVIRVLEPLGGHRWHHYFGVRATYVCARSKALDARFALAALDARFNLRVKGIGHGSSAAAMTKALGEPDRRRASQSPSLSWVYYAGEDVVITLHGREVYELKRGAPDWPK